MRPVFRQIRDDRMQSQKIRNSLMVIHDDVERGITIAVHSVDVCAAFDEKPRCFCTGKSEKIEQCTGWSKLDTYFLWKHPDTAHSQVLTVPCLLVRARIAASAISVFRAQITQFCESRCFVDMDRDAQNS
jgi:hypothetical protein